MAEAESKVPVKTEAPERPTASQTWRPFESLRREVDQLFEDFSRRVRHSPFRRSVFDIEPFWRRELTWRTAPAIDIAEKDNAYAVTAELPGMDEKNIEVRLANGNLVIKGEKEEEKEEKKKDYYLRLR